MVEFDKIETTSKINSMFVDEFYDKHVIDFFVHTKILPEYTNYVLSNPYEIKDKVNTKLIKDFNYIYHTTKQYGDFDTDANIKIYKKKNNEHLFYYIKYRIIDKVYPNKDKHIYYNIELEFIKKHCIVKLRKETGGTIDFSLASAIADYMVKNKLANDIKFRTFDGYHEDIVSTFCLYEKNVDVIRNLKYLDNETEIYIVSLKADARIPKKLLDRFKAKNIIYYYR